MTTVSHITDVEAINRILSTVGAEKIASTSGLSFIADSAYQDLKNSMRDLMSHPWGFNTEYEVVLTPDVDDKIDVPDNASIIDLAPADTGSLDVIIRADGLTERLYDRKTHSFTAFTGDSYKATVVYYLEWLDIPEAAKIYIIAMAAVHFQATQAGNGQIDQILRAQLVTAKSAFESFEAAQESWSIWEHYDFSKLVSGSQRPQWGNR